MQARMSSTRLSGKVLANLGGQPVIARVLSRLAKSREIDEIVVATSTEDSDDPLADTVEQLGWPVVRGPLDDVLARYALAAREHPGDGIVRITADCPFIDPEIVDDVVRQWRESSADYVANIIEPRTFPKGLDTEVISRSALEIADAEATDPYDREHVTPYIRNRPARFPSLAVRHSPPCPDVRLVLDTDEDLALLRSLMDVVGPDASMAELVAAHPHAGPAAGGNPPRPSPR